MLFVNTVLIPNSVQFHDAQILPNAPFQKEQYFQVKNDLWGVYGRYCHFITIAGIFFFNNIPGKDQPH